jgi:O-antigen ligase
MFGLKISLTQVRFLLIAVLASMLAFNFPAAFIVLPLLSLFLAAKINKYDFSLKTFRVSKKGYVLTILFGIHLLWFFLSIVESKSFSYLEKTLPFLLFPLMISSTLIDKEKLKIILMSFIYAVILSYSLSLVAAIYHYFNSVPRWGRASDFFFHEQFTSGLFSINPTYYSLLGCLASLFAFQITTKWNRFLIVLILTVFIILINARTTILIQCLLFFSFLVRYFYQGFTLKKVILVITGILIFVIFINITGSIYDYPHRKMFTDLSYSWERSYAPDISDGEGGLVTRFAIWRSAIGVIKNNSLFGVGLGNEKESLVIEFKKNNIPFLVQNAYNAHNQVLSYLICLGPIGLILLGSFFFILLKNAYSKRCWFYFEFLAIFFIVSMTESIFNRGLGISVFALFNSLLFLKYVNNDE